MKTFIFLLVQIITINPRKLFTLGNNETLENTLVNTWLGPIQGTIIKTLYGHDIYAFRGIPYAKPPIGELRFKPPEPITPWQNITREIRSRYVRRLFKIKRLHTQSNEKQSGNGLYTWRRQYCG